MKTNSILCVLVGILAGTLFGGFVSISSLENRIKDQTEATIAFIELLDECDSDLMDDVIVETDEWENLSKYLEY